VSPGTGTGGSDAGRASAWVAQSMARGSRLQGSVCRALQERVLSAGHGREACVALAGVGDAGWSSVVSWSEAQMELVVTRGTIGV